jgi:riboflavin kinase/FMN adenylyltransferase
VIDVGSGAKPRSPGCSIELVRGLENLQPHHRGNVVTIGNYDGVHRGHQHMLAAVTQRAHALDLPAAVITFEPTPREYFEGPSAPARLMRLREKLEALSLYGVDRVIVLRFSEATRAMCAADFERALLVEGLGVRHIVVGHDFHYAKRREGDIETLRAAGQAHGFTVEEVGPFLLDGDRVSSSLVREALNVHDLELAERLTGRPYRMTGRVRRGSQLGRKLGYPTANLALHRKVVPLWGIFAVRITGGGVVAHPAVASLGTRPTVDGTVPLLEVHLFDFDGDLYGQYLSVDFVQWLRDEVKFDSLPAMVEQIHVDAAQARAILGLAHAPDTAPR